MSHLQLFDNNISPFYLFVLVWGSRSEVWTQDLGHKFGSRFGLRLDIRDYDKPNHAFGSEMHLVIIDFSGLGNNKSSLSVILCIVCAVKFYMENKKKMKKIIQNASR